MHRFESGNTVFHFNSDLSGDVLIEYGGKSFAVPGAALVELVAGRTGLEELRDLAAATYQIVGNIMHRDDDETLLPLMDLLGKAMQHSPLGCDAIDTLLPYTPKNN